VVGAFWLWILNPSYGLLSYALDGIGIEPGLMLGDPSMALWLLVLVTAWWSFSYATVMMAAAVQSVPRELHEAVSIDGGGSVAQLVHVTWPHLAPTMGSTALALSITYLTLITLIIVLTGGGPIGAPALGASRCSAAQCSPSISHPPRSTRSSGTRSNV
jgi:multiple sugar transport system permease protein